MEVYLEKKLVVLSLKAAKSEPTFIKKNSILNPLNLLGIF